MEANKEIIKKWLKMTEDDYNLRLFEAGCSFFETRYDGWEELPKLLHSPVIWNWWKSIYELSDAEFVESINTSKFSHSRQNLQVLYRLKHSPDYLVHSPSRCTLEMAVK